MFSNFTHLKTVFNNGTPQFFVLPCFLFFLSKDCDDSVTVFTAEKRKDFLLSLMMIFFSLPIFYFRLPKGAIKSLFIFRILRTNWSAGVPAARFPHRTKIKGGTQKSI